MEGGVRASVALVLLSSVGLSGMPPAAGSSPAITGAYSGPGWTVLAIEMPVGTLEATLSADAETFGHLSVVRVYDASMSYVAGSAFVQPQPYEGAKVELEGGPSFGGLEPAYAGKGIYEPQITIHGASGLYFVLFWTAGDVNSWGFSIDAPAGLRVLGQTVGNATFDFASPDFAGGSRAEVHIYYGAARVHSGSSLEVTIHDRFVGEFTGGPLNNVSEYLRVRIPSGETRDCPCGWGLGSTGAPGKYTFEYFGVGVTLLHQSLWLVGADVRIPSISGT